MDEANQTNSALDVTLDEPLASRSLGTNAPARIEIVEGSGPELSGVTHQLLRDRLRTAGLLLFSGFLVFWLAGIAGLLGEVPRTIHYCQFFVTTCIGLLTVPLCRHCDMIPPRMLRLAELLMFGLPALFFLVLQIKQMTTCAEMHSVLPNPYSPWILLIFTYAMFIPNTWRRAATVIGMIAATPVIVSILLVTTHTACRVAQNANSMFLVHGLLIMLVSGAAAAIGVNTIGSLRSEAFKARQLGQYHLRKLIGKGGMGEVYLAEHQLMKRPCAIKIIHPDRAGDPRAMARFEREVQTIAKLSHWNNVDIYDYGRSEDGTFYYVMEYLPGLSLQRLVEEFGPLSPQRIIYLLRQTCNALKEAHDLGVIHRDIKPSNIIAARRGGMDDVAKLLDFGLAKPISDAGTELSMDNAITGSPLYMSPEHATGDGEVDARSDIYAIGAVGYYLLTGQPPFQSDSAIHVLVAHANRPPTKPSDLNGDVPHDLEEVVLHCLAKNPDDRYQDVGELSEALGECDASGSWTHKTASQWWQRHASPEAASDFALV